MKKIKALVAALMLLSATATQAANFAENDSVGPLLGNINFAQGTPYNNKCPNLGDGGRSLTGCVATAMAQIMAYYKYPTVGQGTATYTSSAGANTYVYSDHPFDWAHMKDSYYGNYTTTEANAVAELMLACGASVNMNYSASGSGARLVKAFAALKDNFKYSDVQFAACPVALDSDPEVYEEYLYTFVEEFKKGHPILYASCPDSKSGHAFVLDGYKVKNGRVLLHTNWGWGGSSNGWFELNHLTSDPDQPSYSFDVEVVYNFCPPGWTGIDELVDEPTTAQKILRNGQLIICKNGKEYTITGTLLK